MKRAFPQKVKPVSSQPTDKETLPKFSAYKVGLFKQAVPEGNRRARASAAMIGLAISMGASSMVIPRQGDGAIAAEPKTADPTAPTALTSFENGAAELGVVVEASGAETATHSKSAIQPHSVLEEPVQWQPSQTELVSSASAAKDGIGYDRVLSGQAKLQSPSENSSPAAMEAIAKATARSERDGVERAAIAPQETEAAIDAASLLESKIAGDVSAIFEAKQNQLKANKDILLEQFEPSSNRLKDSLAEFGTEESVSSPEAIAETAGQQAPVKAIASPLAPQATPADEANNLTVNPAGEKGSTSPVLIPLPGAIAPSQTAIPTLPRVGIPQSDAAAAPANVFSPLSPAKTSVGLESPTLPRAIAPQAEPAAPAKDYFLRQPLPTPEAVATPNREPAGLPVTEAAARPSSVKEPATPAATSEKVVTPDFSKAVAIEAEVSQPVAEYRVSAGDTLDSISRTYGVAPSVLAKSNQLSDPNLLAVGQTIEIPLYQPGRQEVNTSALIEKSQPYGTAALPYLQAKKLKADKLVPNVALPISGAIAYNPALPLGSQATPSNSTHSAATSLTSEDESANEAAAPLPQTASAASVPAPEQPPALEPEIASNPYNNGLMSEMLKIREKYRSQKTVTPANPGASSLMAETNELVEAPSNNEATPARVNPEFIRNQYVQAGLSGRNQNQQPSAEQLQARTEGPTSEEAIAQVSEDMPVMATAPTGTEAYESVIQPRMVSPELPPLASPDTYLPKGSAAFAGYIWPAQGELTSGYGWRWGRMHRGIDVAGPIGTPIVAAAPGVVTYARWNEGGYGNLVEVTHPDGSITIYAHNDRILVREGQEVEQGQQVAEMGSTGFSTGPHLHFEIHPPGQGAVNPIAYLPQ